MQSPYLSVVIPVYNEEATISSLLDRVEAVRIDGHPLEILIVNDGSSDGTAFQIRSWIDQRDPKSPNKVHCFEKINGGKGSAVREGILHSTGGAVIIQDADLEYDPNDYAACVLPIFEGREQVVYGTREDSNRNRIYSSPFFYLGALSLTFWINLLFNANLTDEATCYKAFDGDLIRNLYFEGDHFEWEPEITSKLLRLGYHISEVSVAYHPRKEGKKIKFRDGLQGFLTALRWRFHSLNRERAALSQVSPDNKKQFRQTDLAQYSLLFVVLLAILIRLIYAIPGIEDPQILMRPDSSTYLNPARSLLFDGRYASGPGGELTAFRTPLYPLYLAVCLFVSNHSLPFCVIISSILGGLIVCPVYLSARLYGGWKSAFFAAALFALNPTAIALSPMFLSDTLFMAFFLWQMLFMLKYVKCKFALFFFASVFFAALGTLVRPINMLWILPCLFVLWCMPRVACYLKGFYTFFALTIFCVVLVPWAVRNERLGFGFRLDSSDVQSLTHSVSTMMSLKTGYPAATIRNIYQAAAETKFALEPEKYQTPAEQARFKTDMLIGEIKKDPGLYLLLHFRPFILCPDIPYFLENLKLTTTGQGTFAVLNQHGIFAAARYYFNGNKRLMFLIPPLVIISLLTYAMAFKYLWRGILRKYDWMLLLLFLLLAEYYLFLPGPVAMPRYQLPAVAFFCVLAGAEISGGKSLNSDKGTKETQRAAIHAVRYKSV